MWGDTMTRPAAIRSIRRCWRPFALLDEQVPTGAGDPHRNTALAVRFDAAVRSRQLTSRGHSRGRSRRSVDLQEDAEPGGHLVTDSGLLVLP